ncbi:hypothetical protein K438DRAFT_1817980 [Mycena galopus ATCC 62051]|nr:hypothetical protein K438DRAFT_1817980 [Mycena galopus ATCC 62051]
MAELYPNAHVVGADLARNFQERTPKNFEFVQMNLAEGLPAGRDLAGYDLIHARSFHAHLKDPLAFIRQVEAVLKPGGLFIVADIGVGTFGRDKVQLRPRFPTDAAPETSTSWFMGWQDLWVNTMGPTLRADELLQRSPLSRIFFEKYFCPVGWVGDDIANGEELGDIMLKNTLQWNRATVPAILATGKFSLEELEIWLDAVEDEVKTENRYLTLNLGVSVKKTL